jgi:hypothetical protein
MEVFTIWSSCQPPLAFSGVKITALDFEDPHVGEPYLTLEAYATETGEYVFVKRTDYKFDIDEDAVVPFYVKYLVVTQGDPRTPELYRFCQRKEGSTRGISQDFIKFLEQVGASIEFDPHYFYISPKEAMANGNNNTL